jgi:hypothetical protein
MKEEDVVRELLLQLNEFVNAALPTICSDRIKMGMVNASVIKINLHQYLSADILLSWGLDHGK